jgi:eukaryotic-like serine/threonine-protein kinase
LHVIEAIDPAAALIEFAERNHVRHLVTGARASSKLRRYMGSVSAKVVAEAPCSVTVGVAPAAAHCPPPLLVRRSANSPTVPIQRT